MSDPNPDDPRAGLNRRDFLKTGAAGLGAAGIGTAALGANSAAAYSLVLDTLTEHEGKTLLSMTRQIFPHDFLGDQYYGDVVVDIDDAAADDEELAALIKDGVSELDQATGVKWVDLSPGYQLDILNSVQDGAFFQTVKGKTLFRLYNNPLVWRHFGYEGEAYSKGGYLQRGFDDLNWLPEPPEDASPNIA